MIDESWLSQHGEEKRGSEQADSTLRVGFLNCLENETSMRCGGAFHSTL